MLLNLAAGSKIMVVYAVQAAATFGDTRSAASNALGGNCRDRSVSFFDRPARMVGPVTQRDHDVRELAGRKLLLVLGAGANMVAAEAASLRSTVSLSAPVAHQEY